MREITRRTFLGSAGAFGILSASTKKTDIRIEGMSSTYEDYLYRAPIKFGGSVVDRATLLNIHCTVRTADGKVAKGFGSMPLGNVWSFPSKKMPYDTTLGAMKALAGEMVKITGAYKDFAHPIDINAALEPRYRQAAAEVSQRLQLVQPIPDLCTLVTASWGRCGCPRCLRQGAWRQLLPHLRAGVHEPRPLALPGPGV